ncbi:MAG: hypothetical protein K2P17_06260 [Helicobacteraceae bacterium]|nr:hypothetical protein [Helicobacteraceae bacterium]
MESPKSSEVEAITEMESVESILDSYFKRILLFWLDSVRLAKFDLF